MSGWVEEEEEEEEEDLPGWMLVLATETAKPSRGAKYCFDREEKWVVWEEEMTRWNGGVGGWVGGWEEDATSLTAALSSSSETHTGAFTSLSTSTLAAPGQ